MSNIAIYARVSDDKLKEDGTRRQDIQRQVELLKPIAEFYKKQNPEWNEIQLFMDDGKSAFKEDYQSRPEFCKLMREIKAHRIMRVYVESLDRWSRRVVDGLTTLREAGDTGCTIVSIAEGEVSWTEPQGWFKSLISLGIAEWASREKSWRIKQSIERRKLDDRRICKSCGIIHLGRHPQTCNCLKCQQNRAKKG